MPWVPGLCIRVLIHERSRVSGASEQTVIEALYGLRQRHALAGITITHLSEGSFIGEGHSRNHEWERSHPTHDPLVLVELLDRAELLESLLPDIARLVEVGAVVVSESRLYLPSNAQLVRDVMIKSRATVRTDTPLAEALSLLLDSGIRLLPVLSGEDKLVGILTLGHLLRRADPQLAAHVLAQRTHERLRAYVAELVAGRAVGEVMLADPEAVTPTMSLGDAARFFATHGISRAPVVTNGHMLLGLLRERDLVSALVAPIPPDSDTELFGEGGIDLRGEDVPVTVGAAIEPDVPRLADTAALDDVIQALQASPISLVVVTGPDGALRGVIDEHALLRHIIPDAQGGLRAAVRRALHHSPEQLTTALLRHGSNALHARDIVRHIARRFVPETSLVEAVAEMVDDHESDLAMVITANGEVLGVLSRRRALRILTEAS